MATAPRKNVGSATVNTVPGPTEQMGAEFYTNRPPDRVVTVLALTPSERDYLDLSHIFSHSNWLIYRARSRSEALEWLRLNPMPVLVCEAEMPDGTWKDILNDVAGFRDPPHVIVTSPCVDRQLWAEVLNVGGYDVLVKPLDRTEVVRVISLAWLHWRESWSQRHGIRRLAAVLAAGA